MSTGDQHTLPGIPALYTGDELGASYQPYEVEGPLDRRERVPGLRGHYRRLIGLWRRLPLWLARRLGPRVVRGIP